MASSSTIRCASRALTMAGVHPVSMEFINLDTNRVPAAGKLLRNMVSFREFPLIVGASDACDESNLGRTVSPLCPV
jgi:hypothetical protein